MIKTLVLLSCYLAFIAIYEVDGLRCGPCKKRPCPKPPKCPGGFVKDICDCCQQCAKQEGEKCGGLWNVYGKCDEGLVCKNTDSRYYGKCVVTDICKLPKSPGPCRGSFQKWYYNKEKKQCEKFVYGGCKGNPNRFHSEMECRMSCPVTGGGCPKPCGPLRAIKCQFGNVIDELGCPICKCKPPPEPRCPAVCERYCQYGNLKDKNGCPACNPKCKATPLCPHDVYSCPTCPYGNKIDKNGCPTCKCNPFPPKF